MEASVKNNFHSIWLESYSHLPDSKYSIQPKLGTDPEFSAFPASLGISSPVLGSPIKN